MTRKYSLDEIDRMRMAVHDISGGNGVSLSLVEERLRTYMLNGTSPEELETAARQHNDPVMRRQKELANLARSWTQPSVRNGF